MRAKRKLLISMLAIVFVLLAVVATVAIAFALTQQTITTTLNIGYVVEDIDGTASATYTIGGVTERLTAMKGNQVIGDTLVFHAGDTEDAGNLMFPEGQIPLSAQNDNIVIQYTYSNTGAKHYIASMSFDGNISADNMKVEYSIDGTTYSENRYAVVVPANTSNRSYWIKISIENKAKSASFTGDFRWLLSGCDEQEDSYKSLTSVEFQGSNGSYSASLANAGSYVGEVVFPSSVNGDPVTTISRGSLGNTVISIYIPETIQVIGYDAFGGITSLKNIIFAENSQLAYIYSEAFYGCTGLISVEIPDSVIQIYNGAFSGCAGLTRLKIGSGLTNFERAFSGCISLTDLEVASGNEKYHSSGNCVIETESKTLIFGCNTSVIPTDGSVTSIGSSAFQYCTGLTSITIPNSVTSIGGYAFSYCEGLRRVTISDGVTSIGSNAFECCISLTSINIPNNLTIINSHVFFRCESLISIEISNSVTHIKRWAFVGCKSLANLTVGSGVISIGEGVFDSCDELTNVTFANKTGWSANSTAITEEQLSDPATAATLLKDTYLDYDWTRS